MFTFHKKRIIRWVFIVSSLITLFLILWNTYIFFQTFKEEERLKMELWAAASKTLNDTKISDTDLELPLLILSTNTTIPIIHTTDQDSILSMTNINENIVNNPKKAQQILHKFKSQNKPIEVRFGHTIQYLYYGNSSLLVKLTYYPGVLILIFIIFSVLILSYNQASKMAAQNKLWAGMAKETAHQIGTPLSSLLGWVEIMKLDNVDPTTITEIEKDVVRLENIANRFSKIGSKPQLDKLDIILETKLTFEYLKDRSSKQIQFRFSALESGVLIPLNQELHSWTIENLIKNAIDAMRGKGDLHLEIKEDAKTVKILISDTGSGIAKNKFKKIFEPGYTTKKRGWGLGLSLTKRIVEEFQNGKIKVLYSDLGKGTTFCITYKK